MARDWIEEAVADIERAEGFADDFVEEGDRFLARATAKALIATAGSLKRMEDRPFGREGA